MAWYLGYEIGDLTIHPDGGGVWPIFAQVPPPARDLLWLDVAFFTSQCGNTTLFLNEDTLRRWPLHVLTPLLEQVETLGRLTAWAAEPSPDDPEATMAHLWTVVQEVLRWFNQDGRASMVDGLADTIMMELLEHPGESVTFPAGTVTEWLRGITGYIGAPR
jgi:hypothetical protein